jgi:hypothetical protein
MSKIVATLIAGLFATSAFAAQSTATAPASTTHAAKVDAKADKDMAKADAKEAKAAAKADAKVEKKEAEANSDVAVAKADANKSKAKAHKKAAKAKADASADKAAEHADQKADAAAHTKPSGSSPITSEDRVRPVFFYVVGGRVTCCALQARPAAARDGFPIRRYNGGLLLKIDHHA